MFSGTSAAQKAIAYPIMIVSSIRLGTGVKTVKKTGCWFVGGDDLTGALHDL